jgi:hypothetical protein
MLIISHNVLIWLVGSLACVGDGGLQKRMQIGFQGAIVVVMRWA